MSRMVSRMSYTLQDIGTHGNGGSNVHSAAEIWTYRTGTATMDLAGYSVEATDGGIGKVDEATYDAGTSYIVVDTGQWIFGKKVLLPAGVITDIDSDSETIFVDRTKDEIEGAPEFDEERYRDNAYRARLGGYYGYRDPAAYQGRARLTASPGS